MFNTKGVRAGRVAWLTLLLLPCLALAACTPLDPAPFRKFAAATAPAGPALDAAFALDIEWTRAGLRERLVAGAPEEYRSLAAAVEPEALAAKRDADPLYIKLQHARRAAASLNAAATNYAALLAALAGDEAMTQSRFDGLARELRAQTTAATEAFEKAMGEHTPGYTVPAAADTGTGIFSVAAAEAFRLWVESERRDALDKALRRTQPHIEAWAALLRSALRLIAADLRDEYDDGRRRLGRTLLQSPSEPAKRAAAAELLQRERDLRTALETLQALDRTYAALGPAHAELRKHVTETEFDAATLQAYQSHAAHLQKLYRELMDH
ncbi:MAG: hypothetical protein ACYTGX_12620 [Planctomycetota bacterium]|jgi:hypothetical protein